MQPANSGAAAAQGPPVILKLAYISDREGKLLIAAPRVLWVVALVTLIWGFVVKLDEDPDRLLRDNSLQKVWTPLISICLAAILVTLLLLCKRLLWAWGSRMQWKPAQRLSVGFTTLSLVLQGINATFFLTSLLYTWTHKCRWFASIVDGMGAGQWMIWNTLFLLNTVQAAQLLPEGSWTSLFRQVRARLTSGGGSGEAADKDLKSWASIKQKEQQAQEEQEAAQQAQQQYHHEHGGVLGATADVLGATADTLMHSLDGIVRLCVRFAAFLFLWVPITALIIVLLVDTTNDDNNGEWNGWNCGDILDPNCWPTSPNCQDWDWECNPTDKIMRITWVLGALMNISAAVFLLLMWLAINQLGHRPYYDYRVQNLAARLALRTRVPTYVMFTLTFIFTWYIRLGTCTNILQTWVGLGPMHLMMTATVVAESLLFMPSKPEQSSMVLHDALQKFAWTEREMPELLAERGFPEEPCFCFETAIKACYMSLHVYRHFKPESTVTSIANAMAHFGCSHYEWLREPVHDSNCLLMWGPDSLVITFRGTASMANVKADLKAWRAAHPPRRGSLLMGEMPLVHVGFLKSWLEDGFNTKVLQRVRQILEGRGHADMEPLDITLDRCCKPEGAADSAATASLKGRTMPFRILVTGHSLGGAMSTLCGIDLARSLPDWGYQITPAFVPLTPEAQASGAPAVSMTCYTFGAPRTGNHAFARDLKAHMPDVWSIINGQDVVANQAKFLVLFKRPGFPVLLSRRGDLIVRPSSLEHTAHRTAGTSLKQHMLFGSYCPSLASVLRCQVTNKPMPGGREAMEHLSQDPIMAEVLGNMLGLDLDGGSGSADEEKGNLGGSAAGSAKAAGQAAEGSAADDELD